MKKLTKKQERQIIFDKYDGKCAYCGNPLIFEKMQVDHIIPKYNFKMYVGNKYNVPGFLSHLTIEDIDHIDNLFPACAVCNKWKDTFDLELFRGELFKQIERLNKYSSNFRIAKKYGLVLETPKPIIFYFEQTNKNKTLKI
jgi:5-methylcytosine-specific restriction endonuclease McrA